MPFSVPYIPVPTVEQTSPIAGALRRAPETYMNLVKAKYSPMTTQADALSKIAYANAVMPQLITKLLQNPDIVAQWPEDMKKSLAMYAGSAGLSAGSLGAHISNIFGGNINGSQSQNAPASIQSTSPVQNNTIPVEQTTPNNRYEYDENGKNTTDNPTDVLNQRNAEENNNEEKPLTWSENAAEAASIKKEGEELGTSRGKAMASIGDNIKGLITEKGLLDQITNTLKSPEIQSVRQLPVGGNFELSYYKINGNKKQKEAIGNIESLSSELATQMTQRYKGAFKPTAELPLINQAKVNISKDNLDVAAGKMVALNTLNEMDNQRSHVAYNLMKTKHLDEAEAFEQADKLIHGDEIRKSVQKSIYPHPKEQDIQFMMKKYKAPRDVIINKLKSKGYEINGE